jgi:hypothetical protein
VPRGTQEHRQAFSVFVYGAITLCRAAFQTASTNRPVPLCGSYNPTRQAGWFGLFPFRSPLLGNSFLFLGVLRCFSSPRSLRPGYVFTWRYVGFSHVGFPIRTSPAVGACTRLTGAFRSVPRPSSALDTKASTVRPW